MRTTKEISSLSVTEIRARLEEFKKELLKLNTQVASGANTQNPGRLRQLKKNIARAYTFLSMKEEEVSSNK
ncbi:50S ribosomal protein L29 [Candidatus Woesearchaeota archaeon]|nr:50S ribosomal protein L29 [Candidatus Woesearchaeota archaeon]